MNGDVVTATASLRSGDLEQGSVEGAASEELNDLAATLPEIFGTLDLGCFARIAQRLAAEPVDDDELLELLLLSEQRVQVVHPLIAKPDLALIAISGAVGRLGVVLSQVQARLGRLEGDE